MLLVAGLLTIGFIADSVWEYKQNIDLLMVHGHSNYVEKVKE